MLLRSHLPVQQEQLMTVASAYKLLGSTKRNKRKHRLWVHSILLNQNQQDAYHNLVRELQLDGEKFQQ